MASAPDLSQWLPATAIVAVLVFATREILEWRRRSAADARKLRALKKVLARECELNYWQIDKLNEVLTGMREVDIQEDAARVSFAESASGGFVVTITSRDGNGWGGMLQGVQKDVLLKHLVEIAALSEQLSLLCECALDALAEAEHVFSSLVYGPEAHFPSTRENYFDGLIDYGLEELRKSSSAVKELYFSCTGLELTRGKLR